MRHALLGSVFVVALAGCTAPPVGTVGDQENSSGDQQSPGQPAANGNTDQASTSGSGSGNSQPPTGGTTTPPAPPAAPASAYSCTPAGIAAYADALVTAGRTSCVNKGVGVVMDTNYTCMQSAITSVNPPNASASFNVIDTLLKDNTQFPYLECTYFVQAVTAGACGTPISPSDVAWTDYPLAYMFAGKQATGFTWYANNGTNKVQAGDIIVYNTTGGEDPGHIMIVAATVDATHFRLAEANELTSSGAAAFQETGVVSNTRVATLTSPHAAGWFRVDAM